jgi:hydrogenase maturation protease
VTTPRTIVIGFGNPGRLDDGLGPAFAGLVRRAGIPGVEALDDFQLQAEHAADLLGHDVALFADASVGGPAPYEVRGLLPGGDGGLGSHALLPETVVRLACDAFGWGGRAYVLGIRGEAFDGFGEWLSEEAGARLRAAADGVIPALRDGRLGTLVRRAPTRDTTARTQDDPRWTTTRA